MKTNMELEKHVLALERDNLRLMSILKSYGYSETDQQRELLLADYTPPASLKLSRQLDVMMMMNGLCSKEQRLANDYVEGKIGREDIEHLAKKFILKEKEDKDEAETDSLKEKESPSPEVTIETQPIEETDNFRLVEKPSPQPLVKL